MLAEAAVAGFIAKNYDRIITVAKNSFERIDEDLRIALKLAYRNYLSNTIAKYSKSKSFFIRNEPTSLYDYYVPIGVFANSLELKEPNISNCLELSKRIIVAGTGGTGKSILMKHLFLDCINSERFVPIMVELRDLNEIDSSLDSFIEATLESYGFTTTGNFIEKSKKSGHFCFFFDGYDEVNHDKRKKLIKEIKQISDKYSKCPIILSSRPDEAFNGLEVFSIFNILPMDLDTAVTLVNKLPFDSDIKGKFVKALRDKLYNEHESFLSNPLLLSIMLLTYGENSEIPSKLSIFYNQAFEALFRRHDAYKGGYNRVRLTTLDIQDFSRAFSLFSLQTYEKREFKMSRISCLTYIEKSRKSMGKDFAPESYLQDLLTAACLLTEDGLDVAFSHRSFQEYFVALHISAAAPEIQEALILRYWRNMKSDDVIKLLIEINPELVERVLLIPELDKLFSKLKVKKTVGITHTAAFFKQQFSQINIERRGLTATSRDPEASVFDLAKFVVPHGGYIFPNSEVFKAFDERMVATYGIPKKEVTRFSTSTMTYKTPILNELLHFEGRFSIKYFKALFAGYKRLKSKHTNRLESLDRLLGI
ncbi:NACHT domain-containing protein [Pseudomonas fitomaticsae]|uniref:NACHT domain-containing protein n=1 Tax=Pseudomonas fitomaticsae TaxID=2837969 RepID=A0ABY3PWU5_9PSED|nr:NACHT domain-containing protein [Pseudomonas fitomaticsae]UFP98423.1 NACHT domain-containing protein [Pseudomonas fitomaticsae]